MPWVVPVVSAQGLRSAAFSSTTPVSQKGVPPIPKPLVDDIYQGPWFDVVEGDKRHSLHRAMPYLQSTT